MREAELANKKRRISSGAGSSNSDDSDDNQFISLGKKRRKAEKFVKLNCILSELSSLRESVEKVFSLTPNMKIPVGLQTILYETFKCAICQSTPIQPPIIFAKCCKSILGCERCVDTWYEGSSGQSRSCPKCRAERAFVETCRLNGMDDFLKTIAPLLNPNQEGSDTEDF